VLACSETLHAEMGANPPWIETMRQRSLDAIHGQLHEAAFLEAWEQGRQLRADEALTLQLESIN
jgi:hypothetical protein